MLKPKPSSPSLYHFHSTVGTQSSTRAWEQPTHSVLPGKSAEKGPQPEEHGRRAWLGKSEQVPQAGAAAQKNVP